MVISTESQLTARGLPIDVSSECFGRLRSSSSVAGDPQALRARMQEDGYLFLPGYLDPELVLEARRVITGRLAGEGLLQPDFDPIEAVARPGIDIVFRPDLAMNNPPLDALLYGGSLMSFYELFLGEPVRHYDFTWLRAAAPGVNSSPHCDIVYMGRGTFDVFTAWTPLGDIGIDEGALMILEGSNGRRKDLEDYLSRDVDTYCLNGPNARKIEDGETSWEWDGALEHDAVALRERLGGRWLSSDFKMGDFLTFGMGTVHASLDNHSNRIRLSSDSRYQRASEPADERWIGPNPPGHSRAAKRGRIC